MRWPPPCGARPAAQQSCPATPKPSSSSMATPARKPGAGWPAAAGLAALAVGGHLYGLYRVTGPHNPPWFPQADKLEHVVGFALPVVLVLVATGLRSLSRGAPLSQRARVLVLAVFAAHGVASELVQHFFYTNRAGDPLDVLADWTGTALGLMLAHTVLRRLHARDPGRVASAPRAHAEAR